jgi:hypothetical protein
MKPDLDQTVRQIQDSFRMKTPQTKSETLPTRQAKRTHWSESDKLICPECQSKHSRLIDTRTTRHNTAIRRRRVCDNGHRFTTNEVIVTKKSETLYKDFPLALTRQTIRIIQKQFEVAYMMGRTDADYDAGRVLNSLTNDTCPQSQQPDTTSYETKK